MAPAKKKAKKTDSKAAKGSKTTKAEPNKKASVETKVPAHVVRVRKVRCRGLTLEVCRASGDRELKSVISGSQSHGPQGRQDHLCCVRFVRVQIRTWPELAGHRGEDTRKSQSS